LLPLLSFLFRKGRCGRCRAAIDPLHVQVETLCALLAGAALLLEPNGRGLALAAFWLLLAAPAVLDARHHWLPDRLTLLIATIGLPLGTLVSEQPLVDRLLGGSAGFLALWLIGEAYRQLRGRTGLGSGDPKLLGAIGLWAGWQALPPLLLVASLLGLTTALVQRRSRLDRLPFGTLLSVAAIVWTALPPGLLVQIARS
jgi:leader peptidase (prepilin peptidase)/N-methyltransferase